MSSVFGLNCTIPNGSTALGKRLSLSPGPLPVPMKGFTHHAIAMGPLWGVARALDRLVRSEVNAFFGAGIDSGVARWR